MRLQDQKSLTAMEEPVSNNRPLQGHTDSSKQKRDLSVMTQSNINRSSSAHLLFSLDASNGIGKMIRKLYAHPKILC